MCLCVREARPRGQQEALRRRQERTRLPGDGWLGSAQLRGFFPPAPPTERGGGVGGCPCLLPGPTPGHPRGVRRALSPSLLPQVLSPRGLPRSPPLGTPGGGFPDGVPQPVSSGRGFPILLPGGSVRSSAPPGEGSIPAHLTQEGYPGPSPPAGGFPCPPTHGTTGGDSVGPSPHGTFPRPISPGDPRLGVGGV